MNKKAYEALINGLIAYCQRQDLLPTDTYELADELQMLVADEMYISKSELINILF